jgi:hypothetical protein
MPSWLVIPSGAGRRAVLIVSSRSSPPTAVRGLKSSSGPRSTNKQQLAPQQREARTSHNRRATKAPAPIAPSRHVRGSRIPAGGRACCITRCRVAPARAPSARLAHPRRGARRLTRAAGAWQQRAQARWEKIASGGSTAHRAVAPAAVAPAAVAPAAGGTGASATPRRAMRIDRSPARSRRPSETSLGACGSIPGVSTPG